MNWTDRLIAPLFPRWAASRARYRQMLAAYEAVKPSRLHKLRGDQKSAERAAGDSMPALRRLARELDENNDIARGILNVMVNAVVGAGLIPEPQVRTLDGELAEEFNDALLELYRDWIQKPEVTWELDFGACQRLMCRAWLRDGEHFIQLLEGHVPALDHGTRVPFSIELLESEMVPVDFEDERNGIRYGIERNAWGRAVRFYVYKQHPGDTGVFARRDTKPIRASKMLHVKYTDRIRQGRGVSVFASVFNRMDDLRDYEESERVAARIAAAMTLAITKSPDLAGDMTLTDPREFEIAPGMVWDDLLPGEEPKVLSSERPSNALEPFRQSQLRAVASGVGAGYSSIAKDYNGTYSAQRQELVEQYGQYLVLREAFASMAIRPIWQRFVRAALVSSELEVPADIDDTTLDDADFVGQGLPWIDPLKEINAYRRAVEAGFMSRSQVIRRLGGNPKVIYKQLLREKQMDEDNGMTFQTSQGATQ